MKICIKCGEAQPLENFYTHKIKAYEKERSQLPHRKALRAALTKKRRYEVDGYEAAHLAVGRAIKKGELTKETACQVCGKQSVLEAHHDNYERENKLNVIWLCRPCHRRYHLGKTADAETIRRKVCNYFATAFKLC